MINKKIKKIKLCIKEQFDKTINGRTHTNWRETFILDIDEKTKKRMTTMREYNMSDGSKKLGYFDLWDETK